MLDLKEGLQLPCSYQQRDIIFRHTGSCFKTLIKKRDCHSALRRAAPLLFSLTRAQAVCLPVECRLVSVTYTICWLLLEASIPIQDDEASTEAPHNICLKAWPNLNTATLILRQTKPNDGWLNMIIFMCCWHTAVCSAEKLSRNESRPYSSSVVIQQNHNTECIRCAAVIIFGQCIDSPPWLKQ